MAAELDRLESRKAELERAIAQRPEPLPRLHPNLAEIYRRKVADLTQALNAENTRAEAAEIIRTLIEEIRIVPAGKDIRIQLVGADPAPGYALTDKESLFRFWSILGRLAYSIGVSPFRLVWGRWAL